MYVCDYHAYTARNGKPCPYCQQNAIKPTPVPVIPMATPIADAFAYGRAVDPAAMALIRKLEMDRAELLTAYLKASDAHGVSLPYSRFEIVTKFPLDKV